MSLKFDLSVDRRELFKGLKRIVVKAGTRVLTASDNSVDEKQVRRLAREIAAIHKMGIETVLVSSGAVGVGMGVLGLKTRPKLIPRLQAAAAVGQNRLVQMYAGVFKRFGFNVGQVLLTASDLHSRTGYVNVRNTLQQLLDYKVIPIINENDSVGTEELQPRPGERPAENGVLFGDNDMLSAQIANVVEADLLVILSDIDGLYSADPKTDPDARLIRTVDKITPQLEKLAGREGSLVSVGGMRTKIKAAKVVTGSGEMMIIADGKFASLLDIVKGGQVGTLFLPGEKKLTGRKRWIAYTSRVRGEIVVDAGARVALVDKGTSLLAPGIVSCKGEFLAGDHVDIRVQRGRVFARGRVEFARGEIDRLLKGDPEYVRFIEKGMRKREIVHRDNLVVL